MLKRIRHHVYTFARRLRGGEEGASQHEKGEHNGRVPWRVDTGPGGSPASIVQPRLRVAMATDIGQVREQNEDRLLVLTSLQAGGDQDATVGLFIVADGMGGHVGGEQASDLAARTVAQHVTRDVILPLLGVGEPDAERKPLQEVLHDAVAAANIAVRAAIPEGGTTLTCALVVSDQLIIAHVGDSRAYLVESGGMKHLTRDHSLVQRLQELGQLTAAEAAVHPSRNMLYRAVGQGDLLEPDLAAYRLVAPARLLLCSDGLWGVVPEDDIHAIIIGQPSLQAACQALIEAANRLGGPDNITAILVDIQPPVSGQ
jgi:serine/threonine protein phosphatase PrpC